MKNEKDFVILAVVAGIVMVFWWMHERRVNAAQAVTGPAPEADFGNWPMNTGTDYSPPSLDGLSINIANQTPNLLTNQYIPLFGFVGMAQGTYYN